MQRLFGKHREVRDKCLGSIADEEQTKQTEQQRALFLFGHIKVFNLDFLFLFTVIRLVFNLLLFRGEVFVHILFTKRP